MLIDVLVPDADDGLLRRLQKISRLRNMVKETVGEVLFNTEFLYM
jgi:hypothetical protein